MDERLGPSSPWEEATGTVNGQNEGGLFLFGFQDGLRWQRIRDGVVLPFSCDTQNQLLYDARIDEYGVYVRDWDVGAGRRFVGRATTPSLDRLPFGYEEISSQSKGSRGLYGRLLPENTMPVFQADGQDRPQTDIYNPCINIYPWADDVYLAFPSMYRHYDCQNRHGRDHREKYRNDGVNDAQLAVSRDGIHFHLYRTPYVSLGLPEEERIGGTLYMGVGMIKRGNHIYQYYLETPLTHGVLGEDAKSPDDLGGAWRNFQFRMVAHRLDGFVSAEAGPGSGS